MNLTTLAGLAAVLAAGSLQAQDVDVQAELARQNARIAELEKKAAAAKVDTGTLKFPAELTPYILIDTSLVSKTNATADGRTKFDMATPFLSGSRWGLKGDIKTNIEGLNVIYKLESEYTTADGAMDTPGVLFNRDAWVGFKSELFGQITIGRQNTLARDFAVIYGDPFKEARINYDEGGWTNTNNFKQLIYFAASVDGTRVNRGITWKKVSENGWAFGAAYNLTSSETNTSTKNSTAEVALGYNAEAWHASIFHSEANNNGYTQKSTGLGGNVNRILSPAHAGEVDVAAAGVGLLQQLHALQQEVVEIERVVFVQTLLVKLKNTRNARAPLVDVLRFSRKAFGIFTAILSGANRRLH